MDVMKLLWETYRENDHEPETPEKIAAVKEVMEAEEAICAALPPEMRDAWRKYQEARWELQEMCEKDAFSFGYHLCVEFQVLKELYSEKITEMIGAQGGIKQEDC